MLRSILTTLLITFSAQGQETSPQPQNNAEETAEMNALKIPTYLVATTKISKETETLLIEHGVVLDKLIEADAKIRKSVEEAKKWEREQSSIKKGEIDALKDKAERLSTSNQLRHKIVTQLEIVSSYVSQLKINREMLIEQRVKDEKRWAMEAYQEKLKKLEEDKKRLEHQLKLAAPLTKKATTGEVLAEENVQYETVKKPRTLQDIAWQYYNDNEMWKVIYNYPGNKEKISEESASALIPAGTILTIPNLDEE